MYFIQGSLRYAVFHSLTLAHLPPYFHFLLARPARADGSPRSI